MIEELGPVPYHSSLRQAFRSGELCETWAAEYPTIFDEQDLEYARNQGPHGYHFHEWLSAIVLYHTTGYLSLVEAFQFENHPRKRAVFKKFASKEVADFVFDSDEPPGAQCPDLALYKPDFSDWFFCEVKGPRDRLSQTQRDYFEELASVSQKSVRILKLREIS